MLNHFTCKFFSYAATKKNIHTRLGLNFIFFYNFFWQIWAIYFKKSIGGLIIIIKCYFDFQYISFYCLKSMVEYLSQNFKLKWPSHIKIIVSIFLLNPKIQYWTFIITCKKKIIHTYIFNLIKILQDNFTSFRMNFFLNSFLWCGKLLKYVTNEFIMDSASVYLGKSKYLMLTFVIIFNIKIVKSYCLGKILDVDMN